MLIKFPENRNNEQQQQQDRRFDRPRSIDDLDPISIYVRGAVLFGLFRAGTVWSIGAIVIVVVSSVEYFRPAIPVVVLGTVISGLIFGAFQTSRFGADWIIERIVSTFERFDPTVRDPGHVNEPVVVPAADPVETTGAEIESGIWKIIRTHIRTGSNATRDEMSADGMKQSVWNAANHILLTVGLKTGYSWTTSDPVEIYDRIGDVEIEPNGSSFWVLDGSGRSRHFFK